MTYQDLRNNIFSKKSYLCVGLDTDPALIPECLKNEQYPLFAFNREIVDATAKYAVAYKPNTAFYEACGTEGWKQFEMTVAYIKEHYPELFVIADAKRGDIGNTAKRYAKCFFETMDCDAVTLAPYMGKDSIAPFLEYKDKWAIVLALTSNPSFVDFELYTGNDSTSKPIYQRVIETASEWGTINNLMFVVGATRAEMLSGIRKFCPDNFLLVPGVGAQGGTIAEVASAGFTKDCGMLVNSSRGIIYASKEDDFAEAAAKAAAKVVSEMEISFK